MGKKLKKGLMVLLVFSAGGISFLFFKSKEPVPAGRFEVDFVQRSFEDVYKEIDIKDEREVSTNLQKRVKAYFLLKYVKNSRSKKAIFLIPKDSKIKLVLFTDPSENREKFKKIRDNVGKKVMVKGKLISHPKYGIEIIVEEFEFPE